jgi:hypothetical protein
MLYMFSRYLINFNKKYHRYSTFLLNIFLHSLLDQLWLQLLLTIFNINRQCTADSCMCTLPLQYITCTFLLVFNNPVSTWIYFVYGWWINMNMDNWWDDSDSWIPQYSQKNLSQSHLSKTNPIGTALGSNMDLCDDDPATTLAMAQL